VSQRDLHWVHISDSHVQSNDPDNRHAHRLSALVEQIGLIKQQGIPLDFVVHTGDLVDDADAPDAALDATRRAAALLEPTATTTG